MSLMYRGAPTRKERARVLLGDVLWAFVIILSTAMIMIASRPATATSGAVLTLAAEHRQFVVARSDIMAMRVAPADHGQAAIHLLLTSKAAAELSQFSRAELGAMLTISAPGEVIEARRIVKPIDRGYLGVTLSNPVRAKRIARIIGGERRQP